MRARTIYCSCVISLFVVYTPSLLAQDGATPAAQQQAERQQSQDGAPANEEDGDATAAPALLIEIAEEPEAIDPASFVAPSLAELISVEFSEASLTEVAKWIEQRTQLPVILDRRSLEAADILPSEPVTDQLIDEPIYLLLDRLSKIEVAWRIDRDIIYLNATEEETKATQQFSVGDLFDLGHDPKQLQQTIENCIDTDSWESYGGDGDIVMLGDVMFVRHTQLVRRKVAGLLQAIRQHGRRTLVFDPPQHALLRQALDRPITVRFDGLPLVTVVRQLESLAKARIRLDLSSLESVGIRERQPIDIHLDEQPLRLVLDLLHQQYELAWHIKNGELVVTAPDAVEKKTAVFDVRDLCRNRNESSALQEAIESQSGQIDWWTSGGTGTIEFPLPGTMVIQQSERVLDEVLQLLENYRTALRASKPRAREDSDPILTRYYRMPSIVAEDLVFALPALLGDGTWKTEPQSDAPGTIRLVSSWPESPVAPKGKEEAADWASAYSVLVIRQRRSVHDEIPALLRKIELGESEQPGGMGGMGGGGFGGGFFRVE